MTFLTFARQRILPSFGPRLRSFYESSVRSATHANATVDAYHEFLGWWERLTGDPPLATINTPIVRSFGEALIASKLAVPTANKHLRALRHCLHRAEEEELLRRRVVVRLFKEPEPMPRIATLDELSAIYWACSSATWPRDVGGEPINPGDYWRATVVVLYNVGLRRRELVSIRWNAVDWDRSALLVTSPKTGKTRVKPLHRVVIEHLEAIRGKREFVFGQAGDREPGSGALRAVDAGRKVRYDQWDRIQQRAGIAAPFFNFHDLRKTCGTRFFEQSPGAAQEMLGHASVETTKRSYAQLSPHTREVAERIRQPAAFYVGRQQAAPADTIKIG